MYVWCGMCGMCVEIGDEYVCENGGESEMM